MPPQKQSAPDTLPANFQGWDSAPDTLPADFNGFDQSGPKKSVVGDAAPGTISGKVSSISAQKTGVLPWLQNLESDVRYGTGLTAPGRALSFLGAKGTDVGAQGNASSPLKDTALGPIDVAQGLARTPSSPVGGLKQAGVGALESAAIPMSFAGPQVSEVNPAAALRNAGEAVEEGTSGARNALARILRYPATARQSQFGRPGTVKNILPSFLQRYTIPDVLIPKGELGTATNPGVFSEIPLRVPKSVLNAEQAGQAAQAAQDAGQTAQTMQRPLRPLVGTPEEFQAYDNQMSRLKQEASDAGTYSAARGKVGKKLNYQQRIEKQF